MGSCVKSDPQVSITTLRTLSVNKKGADWEEICIGGGSISSEEDHRSFSNGGIGTVTFDVLKSPIVHFLLNAVIRN